MKSCLALLVALALAACATTPPPRADTDEHDLALSPVEFARIPGWRADRLAPALAAFRAGCGKISSDRATWRPTCAAARQVAPGDEAAARNFFETQFQPFAMRDEGSANGLFTGYYEPEVRGARTHLPGYDTPLYGNPGKTRGAMPDRAAIDRGALAGRGLELLWLQDPIEAFFLEIQGSGRVALPDGQVTRVNYAGQNGRGYVAIGKVLIDRGELTREEVSLQTIRAWLVAHPRQAQEVMERNPSYVFFKEVSIPSEEGPPGAMEVPLTPGRSIAVDRKYVTLGSPVFINTTNAITRAPIQRLFVAQDTGGAIKGPVRADLFLGWGPEAAELAGRMKQSGTAFILLPRGSGSPSS